MNKFVFKFKSLKKVRHIERERQARQVGLAAAEVQRIRSEIAALHHDFDIEMQRVKAQAAAGEISDVEMRLSSQFRNQLKRLIAQKRKEEEGALQKLEEERKILIEKEKNKKIMEKLEERDREKYHEDMRRYENAEMDEIASGRWFFND